MDVEEGSKLHRKWQQVIGFNTQDQIELLLQYQGRIPPVARINAIQKAILEHPVRKKILDAFDEGLVINGQTRHALTQKEISQISGVKLTNVYFHMDKLLSAGFVNEVDVLSDGRYDISFYGKSGRFYLFQQSDTDPKYLDRLAQLLEHHNTDAEDIIKEFEDYTIVRQGVEEVIVDYINRNIEVLHALEIDLDQLFNMLLQLTPILRNLPVSTSIFNALKIIEGLEWQDW